MVRYKLRSTKKQQQRPIEHVSVAIEKDLDKNINSLKELLANPEDFMMREFTVEQSRCAIVYIDGLIDKQVLQSTILDNFHAYVEKKEQSKQETGKEKENKDRKQSEIENGDKKKHSEKGAKENKLGPKAKKDADKAQQQETKALFHDIYEDFVTVTKIKKGNKLEDAINAILAGNTIFYLDGMDSIIIMDTIGGETRQIAEPLTETLVRGPRAGFVENIGTNLSLIRRYIQDPNLRFKTHQIGKRTKQTLVVAYIEGVTNPDLVKEVNRRLEMIDIDDAIESGFVEQWIEDSFLSPFPQMLNSERPDKVVGALFEGQFAILLNGTPFVLIAPITLGEVLKSTEDYYERWIIGSLLRTLRYFGAFIGIFLPALYIALVSFHQDLLPSKLAFSIAASREGVPFPAFVEAVVMVVTMELLQEAGARLPKTIGQTIGIVGGLVIGDAAVKAGIVSPIMVIVIALTAIAVFTNPVYSLGISFRIIRFGFMFAAATLGLYGIVLAYIMVNIHLVNLKSFGVPYSTPFAPTIFKDWKDLVIRAPMTMLTERPAYLVPEDDKPVEKGVHK